MLQSSYNQFESLDAKETMTKKQHRSKVTIKDLLTLLIGTTIPVAIGIYTAIMNQQAQKLASQQREFEIQRAKELYQQQLYKHFLDDMYQLDKDGRFNESADPWVFANARYRAAHREFDNVRKVQALRFLKERELIGRQRCTDACERENISDIIRLDGLVFDNLIVSSDAGSFTRLNLTCVQFNRVSILNSTFSYVDLHGAVINNSRLNGTTFHGSSLSCVLIQNTSMDRTNFSDSTMNSAQVVDSDYSTTILSDTQKDQANLNKPTTMPTTSRDHTTTEKTTFSSTMKTESRTLVPLVVTSSTTVSISTTDPIALTNTQPSIITTTESTTITTESTTSTTKSTTATVEPLITTIESTTATTEPVITATESTTITTKSTTDRTKPVITTIESATATTEPTTTTIKSITTTTESTATATKSTTPTNEPTIVTTELTNTTSLKRNASLIIHNLPANATWEQQGETIAGGNGSGGNYSQLYWPLGLFVDDDDDQTIVIADQFNNRIMQWKRGDTQGQVVAGGNGNGSRLDQLDRPTDVLIDKETNSLIIADSQNRRVVRWSRRNDTTQGETLIKNIGCRGLAMDEQGNLYVSDTRKQEVRRYEIDRGDKTGTVVAGGNGKGSDLNQLDSPLYPFVDRNQSLYVSDFSNYRVMKWDKGAAQGVVVAVGQRDGSALRQLSYPRDIYVDTLGTLYVAEEGNDRVTRWPQGFEKKGTVVVGGNGKGSAANQLSGPRGLSFDKHGNLYVADHYNNRVQRFNITQ